jgi:hypothetical protein
MATATLPGYTTRYVQTTHHAPVSYGLLPHRWQMVLRPRVMVSTTTKGMLYIHTSALKPPKYCARKHATI